MKYQRVGRSLGKASIPVEAYLLGKKCLTHKVVGYLGSWQRVAWRRVAQCTRRYPGSAGYKLSCLAKLVAYHCGKKCINHIEAKNVSG